MKALVPYECPNHGWVCDAPPGSEVRCRFGPYRPSGVQKCGERLYSGRRTRSKFDGMEAALRGRSRRATKTPSDQGVRARTRRSERASA